MAHKNTPAKYELTPKQRLFVEEYLVDMNATQAAIRAGYKKKAAYRTGFENLNKPQIQAALAQRQRQLQRKIEVKQERVLLELCCLAFFDVKDMMDENSHLLPIHEIPEQTRRAIVGVKQSRKFIPGNEDEPDQVEVTTEYKLGNKDAALNKLGLHLGMFQKELEKNFGNIKMNFYLGGQKK